MPPMSEEQFKAFLEKVKGNTSLQEKLNAASDADAIVAIAKDAGFVISADEITKVQEDAELEGAAGGIDIVEGEDDSWWIERMRNRV